MRTSSCNLTQYNLLTALLILADSRNDHGGSKSRGEDISLHFFEEKCTINWQRALWMLNETASTTPLL